MFGVMILCLVILVCLNFVSAVRINEVMADCTESSVNCEWVEIYSGSSINLTNWAINTSPQYETFNFNLTDFLIITKNKNAFIEKYSDVDESKVIEWGGSGLSNTGDNVSLSDNLTSLVSNFTYLSSDDELSWQYCEGEWIEADPTPGEENSCPADDGGDEEEEAEIEIFIDWDEDDIINGDEFDIEVSVENLKGDDYEVKIEITFRENNTIISETYHEDTENWRSSKYYVEEAFSGSGNKSEVFSLRINEDYVDFEGKASINAKIRKKGSNSILAEKTNNINILIEEITPEPEEDIIIVSSEEDEPQETESIGIIKLGGSSLENKTESIKTEKNVLYESRAEKIKKSAVYFFSLLCVIFIILMLINLDKFKRK